MSQLQLATPGRTFTMWNGYLRKSLGTATVEVCNPRHKQLHRINFDMVSDRFTPILGAEAVQSMGLTTVHADRYDSIATVKPALHTKEDYLSSTRMSLILLSAP